MAESVREFVAEDLWLLVAVVTFALTSLTGLAGLEALAGAIAIVGWFLLTPILLFWGEEIAAWAFDEPATESPPGEAADDPLDELKRRYAEGEIDDDEFDHRLDRLLEADDAVDRASVSGSAIGERAPREAEVDERRERELN